MGVNTDIHEYPVSGSPHMLIKWRYNAMGGGRGGGGGSKVPNTSKNAAMYRK